MVITAFLSEGLRRNGWLGTTGHSIERIEARKVVRLTCGQACGVDAVSFRQGRHVADNDIPLGITCLSCAFTPLVGDVEAILPVSQFEGMVIGEILRHRFLHGCLALQEVTLRCFVVANEVGHELCRGFDLFSVFLEGFFCWIGTIHLLGHIDIVRLLPDEETTRVRRCLASPGVSHLHPADALESLTFCNLAGYGIGCGVIPVEDGGNRLRTAPKGEIDQMPPRHFEVRTAKPRVVGQTSFLRGYVVGAVDLCKVLGKYDATLQLFGARISTL